MAKKQNQSKGASVATVGQAQRVGIFGASGCGKTTKARSLIKSLKRVIFFEPLADDLRRLRTEDGFTTVIGFGELKIQVRKRFADGFKLGYYPAAAAEEKELSQLANWLMAVQSGYGFSHGAQITLVIDELDMSFPSGISQRDPKNGFKNLCCRGRHAGINVIGLSQRMHLIDNVFRANCSATYIFRHSEPSDIDTAVKILGRENREKLRALKNYEYFYKQDEKIFLKS